METERKIEENFFVSVKKSDFCSKRAYYSHIKKMKNSGWKKNGDVFYKPFIDNEIKSALNVIGYSLWGKEELYNIGIVENARSVKKYYPDFEMWVYHDDTCCDSTLEELRTFSHVKLFDKTDDKRFSGYERALWRYEPAFRSDVNIFLSRDADSRIFIREKFMVEEWLRTDRDVHIIRDHISHNAEFLAGMWGCRNRIFGQFNESYLSWKNEKHDSDQRWLSNIYWQIEQQHMCSHSSNHKSAYTNKKLLEYKLLYPVDNDAQHYIGKPIHSEQYGKLDDSWTICSKNTDFDYSKKYAINDIANIDEINELKTRWTSMRNPSSFCPWVALANNCRDWIINLKMKARERKHF